MSIKLTEREIANLPPELLAELRIKGRNTKHALVLDLIQKNGGTASLDQLLIFVYRKNGEIWKRRPTYILLQRMKKKGLVASVGGSGTLYEICDS